MKEFDVRRALYDFEIHRILQAQPNTLVVDELVLLEGKYRADMAVISDRLHGYEIKSAKDNLDRLAGQQACYSMIFDKVTLVAAEKHIPHAVKVVPNWWGLIAVCTVGGETVLNEIWPSRQNLNIDPHALSQLLWRDEALGALTARGLDRGWRSKPRKQIWKALAAKLTLDELRDVVRFSLKARKEWRQNELFDRAADRALALALDPAN